MHIYQKTHVTEDKSDLVEIEPNQLRKDHPEALDLTHPTLIFCPGILCQDGRELHDQTLVQFLNQAINTFEHYLGGPKIHKEDVQLFTLSYSSFPGTNTLKTGKFVDLINYMFQEYFEHPNEYFSSRKKLTGNKGAKEFVDEMILPALCKDTDIFYQSHLLGDSDIISHEFLPKEEIKERLRHLTLIGDSYGSVFCQQIGNYLRKTLKTSKFSDSDIDEILSEIVMIGASNVAPTDVSHNKFAGVYFEGRGDQLIKAARNLHRADIGANSIYNIISSGKNGIVEGEEKEKAIEAIQAPYDPKKEGKDNLEFTPVDKGIIIKFDVPKNFKIVFPPITSESEVRKYKNNETHNSYSYFGTIPGHRDHSDLFARALRNAMQETKTTRKADDLIHKHSQPILPTAVEKVEMEKINKHLDQVFEDTKLASIANHARRGMGDPDELLNNREMSHKSR